MALGTFLKEYEDLLKKTKETIINTQEKFKEIQKYINTNGMSDEISKALSLLSRGLYQMTYQLVEKHTRVNNLRANYAPEDQMIIDEYEVVSRKSNILVRNIITYIQSFEKNDNSDFNVWKNRYFIAVFYYLNYFASSAVSIAIIYSSSVGMR